MNRIRFSTVLALLLLIGFQPMHAQAQVNTSALNNAINSAVTSNLNGAPTQTSLGQAISNSTNVNTTVVPSAATTTPSPSSTVTTSSGAPTSVNSTPTDWTDWIMAKIMTLFAWLLGIAAITLDNAMYYTVVHMGNYINGITAVGTAWRILRDIGNIVLIFGFIVLGIEVILDLNFYGGGTKMLPTLLLAAIFLNFSLFAAEAIVDVGNLFATEFYTQINNGQAAGPISYTQVQNEPISYAIMNQLGFQTIYNQSLTGTPNVITQSGNIFLLSFMGILLFIIAAFVFFSLAFILIARFVVLILLIIVAPLGFAGLAVPKLDGIAMTWWSVLFKQTIIAPIMLLMLYIALAVITDKSFLSGFATNVTSPTPGGIGQNEWTSWLTGNPTAIANFASAILSFAVAMGLLLAVVMLSKKLGAIGGDLAMKAGAALSFGAAAYGASLPLNLASRGGRKALQRYAPNNSFTRTLSWGLKKGEGARMDFRGIPGVKGVAEATGAGGPVGASALGRIRQGREWLRTGSEETSREFEKEQRIPKLQTAIRTQNFADVGRLVGNMSDKELETPELRRILTSQPAAAATLSQARFDKLMQSDAYSDREKAALRTARGNDPRFEAGTAAATLAAMNPDARAQLDGSILARPHVMPLLQADDFSRIQRSGKISNDPNSTPPNQRAALGAHIQSILNNPQDARHNDILALVNGDPRFAIFYGINRQQGGNAPVAGGNVPPAPPGGGQGGYRPPGGAPPRAVPIRRGGNP